MNQKFKDLVKLFQRLPGVGPRQAARFVIALLEQPEENLRELGGSINNLKRDISFCGECFNIADGHSDGRVRSALDSNGLPALDPSACHICHDTKRDKNKIMVVEKVIDLESIEKTGLYKGLYHVLGGAINPLDKITPASLRIKELEKRLDQMLGNIEAGPVRGKTTLKEGSSADHAFQAGRTSNGIELIIATNPNTPGETTTLYLKDLLANKKGVSITRLGRGLSSGSNLEYTDETTLKHALDYRK